MSSTAQDKMKNEKTVMVGGAAMYPSKNIVENAVNSKDHTTLVAAVKAAGPGRNIAKRRTLYSICTNRCSLWYVARRYSRNTGETREQRDADWHFNLPCSTRPIRQQELAKWVKSGNGTMK